MYTDPKSLDPSTYQYTARTPDNKYVFGTVVEIIQSGSVLCSYEEGEQAGNNWDSLSQPRG